jgi:hypothetical protein
MAIDWSGAGSAAVTGVLGMLGGVGQGNRGYHRNKKLMGFQRNHQMQLNRQGADIQYDMWRKTNMPAQVKMMEDAGLNPALMYGMGGAGGSTTGSQGGGSASGGNAPAETVMDLQNALVGAEIAKKESETNLNNARATESEQTVTNMKEAFKEIGARISELASREKLNIANEAFTMENINLNKKQQDKVDAEIENLKVNSLMTQRIVELDYSGDYGKNLFENVSKALDLTPENGALGLDDAVKIGTTIGALGILKSPAALKGLSKPVKDKVIKAVTGITSKIVGFFKKKRKVIYNN